jgi:hypothetical protein
MKIERIFKFAAICSLCMALVNCERRGEVVETGAKLDDYEEVAGIDTSLLRTEANLSFQTGSYLDAVKAYTTLISVDSVNGMYHFRRAYGMAQLNKYDSAARDYQISANLGYREFHSNLNAAFLYMTILNQDSLAKVHLNRCVELAPDSVRPKELLRILEDQKRNVLDDESI